MSSETRQGEPRYWCHICNAEVPIYMAPEPTCQQCNEQFIEELQSDDDPREFLAGDNHQDEDRTASGHIHLPGGGAAHFFSYSPSTGRIRNLNNSERTEGETGGGSMGEIGDDIFQYFAPPARSAEGNQERSSGQQDQPPTPISNLVQNLLTNMLGQNVDLAAGGTPTGEGHGRSEEDETGRPMIFFGNMVDGNVRFEPMPAGAGRMPGSMPRNREGEENSNGNENPETNPTQEMRGNSIASILQFLSAMTGAPIDGGLVGNPNDYVFSQTALDNIITQLMEQAGSASAPPPAPEQVIDSLPKRSLTDKEKTQEIDCAVCKDNFEPTEQVIELPCLHIFHDDCIKPWLKLNGTCPVCRHSVVPEQESDNNNNNSNNNDNSNNDNDNQDTQMETNNAENTQNTQPSNNDRAESHTTTSSQGNNNASHTASFTIVSGNFPGTHSGSGTPTSWPLNLSSAFPWASHLSRSSQQNNASDNNNENESNSHHEDLDLD